MDELKDDYKEIQEFISNLENKPNIKRSARSFWPKFVFHYSPLETAIKILVDGKLKSRDYLETHNELICSIASRTILNKTAPHKKKYVRLYFRPLTPTQYHIEGFRPIGQRSYFDVHCPIPIFFLFDSKTLLAQNKTKFSNGNYSKPIALEGNTAEFLKNLPFNKIYHLGPYNIYTDSEIKFHRCAEVLYPDEMDLSTLKYICCRSEAEKETFLEILPDKLNSEWKYKTLVSKTKLFESKWTYIEKVSLLENRAILHFSPDTRTPGPFEIKLELQNLITKQKICRIKNNFRTSNGPVFNIKIPSGYSNYKLSIYLDDSICYIGKHKDTNLPF